jgi:hypothetical protein
MLVGLSRADEILVEFVNTRLVQVIAGTKSILL